MDIMAISHAGHNHPATPAARAACRKLMAGGGGAPTNQRIEADGYIADHIRKTAAAARIKISMDRRYDEIKMTGDMARRMARTAAKADRIQPRRGGARVAAVSSTCVQAALHTASGRCACGWHTANHCNTSVWACAGH
jgi:hypothetical protein